MKICLVLFLGLFSLNAVASDADARQRLQSLLDDIHSLRAEFSQTVLDAELSPVQETQGSLWLRRSGGETSDGLGKFRWEYEIPYAQTIVADGENLWTYDPELEQATVKPMAATLASSPAAILTGDAPLDESFTVKEIGQSGELYWIELRPTVQDTDFEHMRVALDGDQLDTMELRDNLGQTTRIRFENVERNKDIPDERFRFTLPASADLIGTPARTEAGTDAGDEQG